MKYYSFEGFVFSHLSRLAAALMLFSILSACNSDEKKLNLPVVSKKAEVRMDVISSVKSKAVPFTSNSGSAGIAKPVIASPKIKYNAGEDPEFAKNHGWPVKSPPESVGSILPNKRIVAYYGNPLSKKMGALGEFPKDDMLRRLKAEVAKWQAADPSTPVQRISAPSSRRSTTM